MTSENILIRHICTLDGFESLQSQWDKVMTTRTRKTAFLTWEWLYAWWKTHQQGKELWLITAWLDDELVGMAPLMLSTEKKYGLRYRVLQSLGVPNADEADFIIKNNNPKIITALCNYILQNKSKWDAIDLHEHDLAQDSTQIIKDVLAREKLALRIEIGQHLHIPISGSWESYFNSLSKDMQKNIKQRLRRSRENHKFLFEHHRGSDVKWEYLEAIFRINKNGAFPEKYESETARAFQRELFNLMHEHGWIEIALISVDDEPIAFDYGFNLDGRFEQWRSGYNRNFSKLGIGKSLLYLLLQELFNNGYQELDFLRGEYDHKSDWAPSKRSFMRLIATRSTHLPARLALIIIPNLWRWTKDNILPMLKRLTKK